jgi:hypothetical protein
MRLSPSGVSIGQPAPVIATVCGPQRGVLWSASAGVASRNSRLAVHAVAGNRAAAWSTFEGLGVTLDSIVVLLEQSDR